MKDSAKRTEQRDPTYTGDRWYKALDISQFGEPIGVGKLSQLAPSGTSYHMHWNKGTVTQVDVYLNQKKINYKKFGYDDKGRVVENTMYSPDGIGGWYIADDVWYYTYDKRTGSRTKKVMKMLGAKSGQELSYDAEGRKIEENIISTDGIHDPSYGYMRKTFDYAPEGHIVAEHWFDKNGAEIKTVATDQ